MSDAPVKGLSAEGFRDGETYEQGRPGYPDEAVRFFVSHFGLTPRHRVLDLAAGTGKFTRHLTSASLQVVAVEPSDSMRAQFVRQLPGVEILAGRGEAIPLATGSLDAVFVAQSFHWFDAPRALAEIARVLRPGGGLGLIWNERDESVEWVRRLSIAMRWHECQPYPVGMDFRPVIAAGGQFLDAERHAFRHMQRVDHAALLDRVASTSYIVAMEQGERERLVGAGAAGHRHTSRAGRSAVRVLPRLYATALPPS